MTASWTQWQPKDEADEDPYVAWAKIIGGSTVPLRSMKDMKKRGDSVADNALESFAVTQLHEAYRTDVSASQVPMEGDGKTRNSRKKTKNSDATNTRVEDVIDEIKGEIPRFARNKKFKSGQDWFPEVDPKHAPDKGAVIVGVIDRGIALGHRAQQFADGKTRILAAWQQVADQAALPQTKTTKRLPFGIGLLNSDIDAALSDSRTDSSNPNSVDAEAFNRRVGSEQYFYRTGHRELGGAIAHGSHVLDAATGSWQGAVDEASFKQRVRPMIVNLPDRTVIGLDSRYLEQFVQLGMLWMVKTADSLWEAAHGASHKKKDGLKGYPIVINLSFAKQAGAKDGDDPTSNFVEMLNECRDGYMPVHLVIPTGNDNMGRGHARMVLPPKPKNLKPNEQSNNAVDLRWRIPAGDQSSNYVEVWSEGAVSMRVTDPMGAESNPVAPGAGFVSRLELDAPQQTGLTRAYAALYTDDKKRKSSKGRLIRHLICVSPTELHDNASPEARSGIWTITVDNLEKVENLVTLNVQTDQSDQPSSNTSQMSHFDDPNFQRFDDDTGRMMDSYTYPKAGQAIDREDSQTGGALDLNSSPVRRHGTMNAMGGDRPKKGGSSIDDVTVVGGFRCSDGKPALYSSTGWVKRSHSNLKTPPQPHCALATDDGYAHFGRLSAGSSDGSVRAMQGTSFACSQMTRLIALWLLDNPTSTPEDASKKQVRKAAREEAAKWSKWGATNSAKVGRGRMDRSSTRRSRADRLLRDPESSPTT